MNGRQGELLVIRFQKPLGEFTFEDLTATREVRRKGSACDGRARSRP
jgi:hypothetical protein